MHLILMHPNFSQGRPVNVKHNKTCIMHKVGARQKPKEEGNLIYCYKIKFKGCQEFFCTPMQKQ